MKRKTSKDYRKELSDLELRKESLDAHIKDRLIKLVERFPEATAMSYPGYDIKAKSFTPSWTNLATTEQMLDVIEGIEKYNASQEKLVQLTIEG